jgi:ketosteroid isomerase-like protein
MLNVAVVDAMQPSDHIFMSVDPPAKKMVGEKLHSEVEMFFHEMEMAIQEKDVDRLMALYADSYFNGPFNKRAVKTIWIHIFATMDEITTVHDMTFITTAPGSKVLLIRCTGLLLGVPKDSEGIVAIDAWTDCDHIIAKVNDKWRLVGTAGKGGMRLGFDTPMQPLI